MLPTGQSQSRFYDLLDSEPTLRNSFLHHRSPIPAKLPLFILLILLGPDDLNRTLELSVQIQNFLLQFLRLRSMLRVVRENREVGDKPFSIRLKRSESGDQLGYGIQNVLFFVDRSLLSRTDLSVKLALRARGAF